ncbi:MAG: xanthine dehydrogenase family protein molybdopterin-binding subunit [Alphaproteobacteria bacterium]|nr:xanthine dehydrogenase family protein molybdopterin-binding subunit [Alphaproteobacteria bacterium]
MHRKHNTAGVNRRSMIKLMAATGATLSLASFARTRGEDGQVVFNPSAYLEISEKDGVVLWLKKAEMGQQIQTATAMMMADELGADLDCLTIRQADTHPKFGFVGTGGSFAIPGRWTAMRPLFASARAMLMRAAADTWQVPLSEVKVDRGILSHERSGKAGKIETFAAKAATYDVPADIPLREKKDFRYIGTKRARLDVADILDGTATYGIDVRLPGMRFAVMARSGGRDGRLQRYDAQAALAVPGVQEIHVIDEKVAVIATNSWAAMRGRDALQAEWDAGQYAGVSNETIRARLLDAFYGKAIDVRTEGKLPESAPLLEMEYEMPMALHAALEPVNSTALVENGQCTVWGPIQMATLVKQEVATALQMPEENVTVHTTLLGGAFGRKLERHFSIEAAQIAAKTKGPVQLLLTREDDMAEGGVRPPSVHRIKFFQGGSGVAMAHEYATLSVNAQQDPSQIERKGYDWTSALGAIDIPYRFSGLAVRQHDVVDHSIRLNWWRGTHHNHHAFATECALDEYALAAGADPIDLRIALLTEDTAQESYPGEISTVYADRLKALLKRLKEEVSRAGAPTKGRAVGYACHVYSDVYTYVAHAVEVSVQDGEVNIHRVWAAVDCGLAISPDSVRAQMEGSVAFGLTSALWGDVRVDGGKITDLNFDTCRLMRMEEMPEIRVIIMDNDEAPGGMGEPPLPSITPAFLNAIARAGGPRIRRLPIGNQLQEI